MAGSGVLAPSSAPFYASGTISSQLSDSCISRQCRFAWQFTQTTSHFFIPLIAHDRAGFGGALVSDGLGIMLLALWGFRRGARWVWWTLAGAGVSEFLATITVHLAVGYTNLWHLTPTMLAALPYALGLTLSYPYLSAF